MPELLVLADCSANDFSDVKFDIFRRIFSTVLKEEPDSVHFTYMVKFPPPTGKIDHTSVAMYDAELRREIADIKPSTILLLGSDVLSFACDLKPLVKHRGKLLTAYGLPAIATFSSGHIGFKPNDLEEAARDCEKALNLSRGINPFAKIELPAMWVLKEKSDLITAVNMIRDAGRVSFDFETAGDGKDGGLDTFGINFRATVLCMSIQHGSAICVPLEHPQSEAKFDPYWAMGVINEHVFADPKIIKIGHNAKFDMHVSARYGATKFAGIVEDTMLMHHLLDENSFHGLKELVAQVFPEYAGYEANVKFDGPLKELMEYCALDVDLTLRLCDHFSKALMKDEKLFRLYMNLTCPSLKNMWQVEQTGALIDREFSRKALTQTEKDIKAKEEFIAKHPKVVSFCRIKSKEKTDEALAVLEEKIIATAKTHRVKQLEKYQQQRTALHMQGIAFEFNPNSVPQLTELLYTEKGFKFRKRVDPKTDKEGTTSKDILSQINDRSGFISALLVLRSLNKMKSTYMEGIRDRMDTEDRIHPSFKLHGTETGRLSCADRTCKTFLI